MAQNRKMSGTTFYGGERLNDQKPRANNILAWVLFINSTHRGWRVIRLQPIVASPSVLSDAETNVYFQFSFGDHNRYDSRWFVTKENHLWRRFWKVDGKWFSFSNVGKWINEHLPIIFWFWLVSFIQINGPRPFGNPQSHFEKMGKPLVSTIQVSIQVDSSIRLWFILCQHFCKKLNLAKKFSKSRLHLVF